MIETKQKKMWTGWRGSKEGPQRWQKGKPAREERLREEGLEKRRLRGDLITIFQYLNSGYKENGDSLLPRSHMEKIQGNGLLLGRFQLDRNGKFHTMETISLWNNLPREMDSPTLDTFRICWTLCWAILFRLCFCQERLDHMILYVPSNLLFCDSVKMKC